MLILMLNVSSTNIVCTVIKLTHASWTEGKLTAGSDHKKPVVWICKFQAAIGFS